MGLNPILRTTTSFSALTLLVGSFDSLKPVPDMTYNVFSGTLNPAQSMAHRLWMHMTMETAVLLLSLLPLTLLTLILLALCWHCRLDSSSVLEDWHNFAGKRHLVSWLSWLDFCDQLIANANPIVSRALAHHIRRRLLDDCMEPAVMQTYASLSCVITQNNFVVMWLDQSGCCHYGRPA